jgi:phage-related protein
MKRWRYFTTANGRDVVREELAAQGPDAEGQLIEAMKRAKRDGLFPYEDEQIAGELRAVRVFFDGNTYRLLYAREGQRDQILLALHVINKKDKKLPLRARRLAEKRLSEWRRRGGK